VDKKKLRLLLKIWMLVVGDLILQMTMVWGEKVRKLIKLEHQYSNQIITITLSFTNLVLPP
jgi:hypothetical protein